MLNALRSTSLRFLALAGIAGAAALSSNFIASPARRLAWIGSLPLLPHPPQSQKLVPSEPPPPGPSVPAPKAGLPSPRVQNREAPRVPPSAPPDDATSHPIRDISGQEAWEAFQSGVAFLDARRSLDFTEGHIPRAWSVPIWEAEVDDRLFAYKVARRPGPEDPIVLYCSGGDCQDSHLLATKLLNEGYSHLLIYRAGFPDWVAQGHPVEKGQP